MKRGEAMTEIYVAMFTEPGGNDSDPAWVVGAYSTPDKAKDACQDDAGRNRDDAPAIPWYGSDDDGAWYDGALTPYGYRINRATLDA